MSTFVIALILFALTYVLLFALPKYRAYVALCSAVVFSVWLAFFCKEVHFNFKTLLSAIDFNILMMIAGTMGIVTLFIQSKMPMLIADVLLSICCSHERSRNTLKVAFPDVPTSLIKENIVVVFDTLP